MENQRSLVFLVVVFTFAVILASAQAIPPSAIPLTLEISAPSQEVKVGAKLELDAVLRNTSDHAVTLSFYPSDWSWDVRDHGGNGVIKTEPAGEPPHLRQGSYQASILGAHEVTRWKAVVDKRLDMTKPGKYTIQAVRMLGKTAIRSNLITITVVP